MDPHAGRLRSAAFLDAIAPALDAVRAGENAADDRARLALLRPLFENVGWLRPVAEAAGACMAADTMHLFGLTAIRSGRLRQIVLAGDARLSIVLCALDGAGGAAPNEAGGLAAFSGNHTLLRLLSPAPVPARLARIGRRSGRCRERCFTLAPGRIVALDEREASLNLDPPAGQILFLRGRVRPIPAPLVRTMRIGGTEPVALANGDDGIARSLALAAMLRTLGRPAPVASLRALMPRVHGTQRWTLMREMLAADTLAAWPDLSAMAADEPDGEVRAAALRLHNRLSAT